MEVPPRKEVITMEKTDKELAVELTCAFMNEFSALCSTNRVQGNPHSKEQIVEMVAYFTKELNQITDN